MLPYYLIRQKAIGLRFLRQDKRRSKILRRDKDSLRTYNGRKLVEESSSLV